jgi:uncharacterized repeat protein (TIGR03803 family)
VPHKFTTTCLNWAVVTVAITMTFTTIGAASQYRVAHYFNGTPAMQPSGQLVTDGKGNFYGVTEFSNPPACDYQQGCGTVFKMNQSNGKVKYETIHTFSGPDGAEPFMGLTLDASGNLYGTTYAGGANDVGVVFELSPSQSGWKEQVLYTFGAPGIYYPESTLVFDGAGNLYGTASNGGNVGCGGGGCGGIFELTPSNGSWTETTIYLFNAVPDGAQPLGDLVIDQNGNLYGTTPQWGELECNGISDGCGVVFELSPSGKGDWSESVIYYFTNGPDGYSPTGLSMDTHGNLYGTTTVGGIGNCNGPHCGAAFELTRSNGAWTFTTLFDFADAGGGWPEAPPVVDPKGNLYGTTVLGGTQGFGTVYMLSRSGDTWTERVLHNFTLDSGINAFGPLLLIDQTLLGGAAKGGIVQEDGSTDGTIFSISRN